MLFALGFLLTFLLGGVTGVMLASPPLDFHLHDSYFVVAHFHYVLFGGSVFALFAGVYYWFPKFTGRMLCRGLGRLHFAMAFVGFHLTFFVQHVLGARRHAPAGRRLPPRDGFTDLNRLSSIGAVLLGVVHAAVPVERVARRCGGGELAGDDPWDGHTLEWATTSPPPPHNFDEPLPPIRSNRPVLDQTHRLFLVTWGQTQYASFFFFF